MPATGEHPKRPSKPCLSFLSELPYLGKINVVRLAQLPHLQPRFSDPSGNGRHLTSDQIDRAACADGALASVLSRRTNTRVRRSHTDNRRQIVEDSGGAFLVISGQGTRSCTHLHSTVIHLPKTNRPCGIPATAQRSSILNKSISLIQVRSQST